MGLITQAALCLALNVYHEARSENYDGQMAVAQVTLNRVASEKYPDSICDVVCNGGNSHGPTTERATPRSTQWHGQSPKTFHE